MKTKNFLYCEKESNKILVAAFYAIFNFLERLKINRTETKTSTFYEEEWKEIRRGRFTYAYFDEIIEERAIKIGRFVMGFWNI